MSQKRKHLPDELRPFYSLVGMTPERAVDHLRVTGATLWGLPVKLRVMGEFNHMDQKPNRLNVSVDDSGKISALESIG